jgi:surfeit locus 1 family protein
VLGNNTIKTSHVLSILFVLISLGALISLGVWQLQRKAWKEGLITRLEARSQLPSLSLSQALTLWQKTPDEAEFRRVNVSGVFDHQHERHLIIAQSQGAAWQVMTPLMTADPHVVWVMRGVVPDGLKNPTTRLQSQPKGEVNFTTRIRFSEKPNVFTPPSDPLKNLWYARDIVALNASITLPEGQQRVPFALEVLEAPSELPRPDPQSLNLNNPHLMYALTWFGIALTLVGVSAGVWWNKRRGSRELGS